MTQRDTVSIVERNEDIRPILDAACRYGHHSGGMEHAEKQLALLITTDVHGDSAHFRSAVRYLNEVPSLDAGICLGDMAPENYIHEHRWYAETVLQAQKPWYTVLGNHDGGNSAARRISATVDEQFDKWIRPTLPRIGVRTEKPWYAVRFDAYGVELIVLDCQDVPDDTDEAGDFCISRGAFGFSQAQMDWFVRELTEVPEGYTLVLALHDLAEDLTKETCSWTQPGTRARTARENCWAGLLPELMDAWIRGTFLSVTRQPEGPAFARYMPALTVQADFTQRGKGLFAGYLAGHTHLDAVGHVTAYPEQKYYSFAATANDLWQNHACDLPRAKGIKAEDCISAAVIDTLKRQVKLVRIGACFTMDMTERRFHVGTYGE